MKTIVVFGASGDIGRNFVNYLCGRREEEDLEIAAVGTRESPFSDPAVHYYQVDITKKESFQALPREIYAVVHLAGLMPARMEGYDPQRYIDVNITGTLNILDYCRQAKADRILFSQSFGDIKDYGETEVTLKPDMPRKFSFTSDHTVYVMTKNFAVDLIEHYHQMYGLKRFIFRLPTIYLCSPVDTFYVDGVQQMIAYRLLIRQAMAGKDLEIWGDPDRVKDMIYIKDFCQMLNRALFVDRDEGYYNAGTGIGTTLADQIKGIAQVFCPPEHMSNIIYRPDKPNAPQYVMDISAAVGQLGYQPEYDYLSMLRDMKNEMLTSDEK